MRLPTRRLAPVVLAASLLAGCGAAPAPQGVCTRYDELKAAAEELRAAPQPTADLEQLRTYADEVRLRLDGFRDLLDRIQTASDGRLDQAIGTARQEIDELRAQLATAAYQTAETLQSQLSQTREDVRTALAPVKNLLDSQCAGA